MGSPLLSSPSSSARSPWSALVLAGLLSLVGFLMLIMLIGFWQSGMGMTQDTLQRFLQGELGLIEQGGFWFLAIQVMNQLLMWAVPAFLVATWLGGIPQHLGLRQSYHMQHVLWATLCILAAIPLVQATYIPADSFQLPEFMKEWEADMLAREAQTQAALTFLFSNKSLGAVLGNLLVFAITPAICEELFFRGLLQGQLSKVFSAHLAIWITAALFSVIHFQFLGFFPRLLLGALLGYFYYFSGSLIPAILAHFAYNAFSFSLAYAAYAQEWVDPAMAEDGAPMPWYLVLGSLAAVGYLMWRFSRNPSPKEMLNE
ncbi:MAG: CPBP family intramembrane glutamic endopeptidase [Bacteroidota bacterium]